MQNIQQQKIIVTPTGLVSRKSAALALGRSSKTLCEWHLKGFGPAAVFIGKRAFYDWDEVQAFASGTG